MSRVYIFNMIDRDRYGYSIRIVVNNYGAAPYGISNTYSAIDFVPFSTSGTLYGGNQPVLNSFIDSNQILTTDPTGGLSNLFDAVATPSNRGDLLAFVTTSDIAVYDQAGNFLAAYRPSARSASDGAAAEAPGAGAGMVYIFNIFSEALGVSSNGGAIGEIPAWSDGSGTVPIYTPGVQLAQRVLNASDAPGNIANGANAIQVNSLDGPGHFVLPVDGNQFPLNQSLLLFIARDHWRLATSFGVVAAEGPVVPNAAHQLYSITTPEEDDMFNDESNTPAGNVYVFNVFSEDLNLSTNGGATTGGTIPAWTMSGAAKYQPNVQAVPRKLNASDGQGNFFNGVNALSIVWLDGLFVAAVRIDGSVLPLNQDLLLFIDRTNWQLVNQFGALIGNGDVLQPSAIQSALDFADLAES